MTSTGWSRTAAWFSVGLRSRPRRGSTRHRTVTCSAMRSSTRWLVRSWMGTLDSSSRLTMTRRLGARGASSSYARWALTCRVAASPSSTWTRTSRSGPPGWAPISTACGRTLPTPCRCRSNVSRSRHARTMASAQTAKVEPRERDNRCAALRGSGHRSGVARQGSHAGGRGGFRRRNTATYRTEASTRTPSASRSGGSAANVSRTYDAGGSAVNHGRPGKILTPLR
jgi:hypothetical protein